MSKMLFHLPVINPFDLDDPDESETPVIGGGTGEGTPYPVSFNVWCDSYTDLGRYDYNHDGSLTQYDYYHWWIANNFTEDQWNAANPGLSFGEGN